MNEWTIYPIKCIGKGRAQARTKEDGVQCRTDPSRKGRGSLRTPRHRRRGAHRPPLPYVSILSTTCVAQRCTVDHADADAPCQNVPGGSLSPIGYHTPHQKSDGHAQLSKMSHAVIHMCWPPPDTIYIHIGVVLVRPKGGVRGGDGTSSGDDRCRPTLLFQLES